jgi:hypothetical protein
LFYGFSYFFCDTVDQWWKSKERDGDNALPEIFYFIYLRRYSRNENFTAKDKPK